MENCQHLNKFMKICIVRSVFQAILWVFPAPNENANAEKKKKMAREKSVKVLDLVGHCSAAVWI